MQKRYTTVAKLRERLTAAARGFRTGESVGNQANTPPATPDTEPTPATEPSERHEQADDPVFQRIEAFFSPYDRTDPDTVRVKSPNEYIQLFDQSAIAQDRILQSKFTLEDLEAMDAENNPELTDLLAARQKLDEANKNVRLFMDGPSRRAAKEAQREAQEAFSAEKAAYLAKNTPDADSLTPLARLTIARARLAEATFASRHGDLRSAKDSNASNLRKAQEEYAAARTNRHDEILTELYRHNHFSDEEVSQLLTSLDDHEKGALAGEESQHYLTEINDDSKKSLFQKTTERYNQLSRPKKIAAMLGAGAIAGFGISSFVAGGAAVAAVYATRFTRSYFNAESSRRINTVREAELRRSSQNATPDDMTRKEKRAHNKSETERIRRRIQEEDSVTYAGTYDQSRELHNWNIEETAQKGSDIQQESVQREIIEHQASVHEDKRNDAMRDSREQETKSKRTAVVKAVAVTALGAAGGYALEHISGFISDAYHGHSGSGRGPSDHAPKTGDGPKTGTENKGGSGQTGEPAPSTTPEKPQVSPQARGLYGDYAGHNVTVTVKPGGSIWEAVRSDMAARNPNVSAAEVNRLTGNVVQAMRAQHGSSLNVIPAGAYSVDLRNAA